LNGSVAEEGSSAEGLAAEQLAAPLASQIRGRCAAKTRFWQREPPRRRIERNATWGFFVALPAKELPATAE